jgi:hypothetical protein
MFKRIALLSIGLIALSATSAMAQDATWEYQGRASTGEKVSLNLESVQVVRRSLGLETPPAYFFTYQIGPDRVPAITGCDGRLSISENGGETYKRTITPQSSAMVSLLDRVCTVTKISAQIIDPPSNVRMGADTNSDIICSVKTRKFITTYGAHAIQRDWFYTDACGKVGLIHASQLRFD